jgi:hypothetical protein
MTRQSVQAPVMRPMRTPAELQYDLLQILREQFNIPTLPPEITLVVEGWTDVSYLQRAAELYLQQYGVDLLEVPSGVASDGSQKIHVCTPGTPDSPVRGGIPQVVRLAEELRSFVFRMDMFRGLVFVFDHDAAGIDAANFVRKMGYTRVLTLDPKSHVNSCAKKQVVVEDLLSLDLQNAFFQTGNAWCSADYEEGRIVRFDWHFKSKDKLRDFACTKGTSGDFSEIIRILLRVREVLGMPTNKLAPS